MVVVVTVFVFMAVVDVLSGAVVDVAVVVGESGMRGIAYNYWWKWQQNEGWFERSNSHLQRAKTLTAPRICPPDGLKGSMSINLIDRRLVGGGP